MAVLLLRLSGPLQAWGSESKFEVRRTELFPTKSGVIGFLAAALGRSREDDIQDLAELGFGVRIEKPGVLIKDFHTAEGKTAQGKKKYYVTTRYYLADAEFFVGVESKDIKLLGKLKEAINAPAFPLFLGRRSCPPQYPISCGIYDKKLEKALIDFNPSEIGGEKSQNNSTRHVQLILEADSPSEATLIRDQPISYSKKKRKHAGRFIQQKDFFFSENSDFISSMDNEHDPFPDLEETACI